MKKIFLPLITIGVSIGIIATACSRELKATVAHKKTTQEQAEETRNRVDAALDSIEHYRDIPPDFTMKFENDTMTNTIWGHMGSPIHFGHIVSAERDFSYEFCSHNPLAAEVEEINATTLRVVSGALPSDCPIIFKDIQQEGGHLLFDIEVCGDKVGSIDLESPHFLKSAGMKGWGPVARKVLKWVAEHIGAPLGVEYASHKIAEQGNSGNSNSDLRMVCMNNMMTQTRLCIEKGGTANFGHGPSGDCPAGCWFSCTQMP